MAVKFLAKIVQGLDFLFSVHRTLSHIGQEEGCLRQCVWPYLSETERSPGPRGDNRPAPNPLYLVRNSILLSSIKQQKIRKSLLGERETFPRNIWIWIIAPFRDDLTANEEAAVPAERPITTQDWCVSIYHPIRIRLLTMANLAGCTLTN